MDPPHPPMKDETLFVWTESVISKGGVSHTTGLHPAPRGVTQVRREKKANLFLLVRERPHILTERHTYKAPEASLQTHAQSTHAHDALSIFLKIGGPMGKQKEGGGHSAELLSQ